MSKPRLSAILCIPKDVRLAKRPIEALAAQKFAELELVVVAGPSAFAQWNQFRHWAGDLRVQLLSVNEKTTAVEAWAEGIRAAQADYVAMIEDHSWPQPGWAQGLWEASLGQPAALGPSIKNANPRHSLSWADYGNGMARYSHRPAGETDHLPSHNSCYHRTTLLERYGDQLHHKLRDEPGLQRELSEAGGRLLSVPGATVLHVNLSRWAPYLRHKLLGGILFGGNRSRHWPLWRRLFYALSSPLIPGIRLTRWLTELMRWPDPEERAQLIRALPHTLAGYSVHSLGEALGYLSGGKGGWAIYRHYSIIELNRWNDVQRSDLELLSD